jgi:hypothetical protein
MTMGKWALATALAFGALGRSPATAQVTAYPVSEEDFEGWSAKLQIDAHPRNRKGTITGLSCVLRIQDGLTLTLTRPVESGAMPVRFEFDIEKDEPTTKRELIERRVVSLGIGGRTYEFQHLQWRLSPVLNGWEKGGEQLPTGIGLAAYRAGEDYPWLPLEYLLPGLMEVETLRLGYRGEKEITHGDYQTVYREQTIRMVGFKAGMKWCGDGLRSDHKLKLPPELTAQER